MSSSQAKQREMWERSPTPPEDWGASADAEWEVKGVVGEETDAYGNTRYEIKWGGWQRPDETNTTWQTHLDGQAHKLIHKWNKKQAKKRNALATESLSIEVAPEEGQLLHEDFDVERLRGYREKLVRAQSLGNADFEGWDDIPRPPDIPIARGPREAQAGTERVEQPARRPRVQAAATATVSTDLLQRPESSTRRGPPTRASRSATSASPALSSRVASSQSALSSSQSGISPRFLRRRSDTPERTLDVIVIDDDLDPRADLKEQWSNTARRAGAEGISIVNEVNDEQVPPDLDKFKYLEHTYHRRQHIRRPEPLVLLKCECPSMCGEAALCGCQDASEVANEDGEKEFAYNENGLFKFNVPPGAGVIECNQTCSCRSSCRNRVAQKPRSVPIEIFRTEHCGWGVRAAIDLPKGRVLGVYTGDVIMREEAHNLPEGRRAYIFDLDHSEVAGEDVDGAPSYSVDASRYGNWSRFLNHSCEPNASVYPVFWDIEPESYMPYLAVVTNRNVYARTELTIDYDPKAGEDFRTSKGKGGWFAMPSGARNCFCGTASCRGWVRV